MQPTSHEEDCIGEYVLSIKQLISRAGFLGFLFPASYVDASNYYLKPWYDLSSFLLPYDLSTPPPTTYVSYFSSSYAYGRGSTRFSSVAFDRNTFQQVTLPPEPDPGLQLFSAAGYLTELGSFYFTVPYYGLNSRVRLAGSSNNVATLACYGMAPSPATRVSVSAADDCQLGYFLGAPPLMRQSAARANNSPMYNFSPSDIGKVAIYAPDPLDVNARMIVNNAYGDPTPVTMDVQDSFTVAHVGNMAWDGSSWTRVGGDGALSVTVPTPVPVEVTNASLQVTQAVTPLPVSVSNTVSATIPDNTPVLIRGLDSSSNPQTFAALPNIAGNHTIQTTVNAAYDYDSSLRPVNAIPTGGGLFGLNTFT